MIYAIGSILFGLLLLIWSADRFVLGASSVAKSLNVAPLLIGMVIVGFGTSTPELFVSSMASMNGDFDIAIGNAVGSNIANIALILGITALITPIAVNSNIVHRELPILLGISITFGLLIWDLNLSRLDAGVLLFGFLALVTWTIRTSRNQASDPLAAEFKQEISSQTISFKMAIVWTVAGLITLIVSSRLLVWGATNVAQELGVSKLIIGLTVVAIGTSLPELVTSVMAALKKEHDVAIGNVIGSNMFNLLAVAGVAGTIRPMNQLSGSVFWRDWSSMLFVTIVIFIMAMPFKGRTGRISRWEGLFLILIYAAYTYTLITYHLSNIKY